MPRNMSFSITVDQMRSRTKTVTRRVGWKFLNVGDKLNAVVKAMGLKPGEKIERICEIRVVDVRREPLREMTRDLDYGFEETTKEGYPPGTQKHWPSAFVEMFCNAMGVAPDIIVTRIEFEYVEPAPTPNEE